MFIDTNNRILHESVKFCKEYNAGKVLLNEILELEDKFKKLLRYDVGMNVDEVEDPEEYVNLKCAICEHELREDEIICRDHNHYR